ncbi:hypothetical protein [Vannielia sp.]|uniref:hypothetical protein n=1 Tax=Vannielia sp. TaxID=2813045 RepID=UPI0026109128|nr:hypothetical protein [Vannielia sp.]MDF1872462.1 hypothetical protein [Vannielia sp.]
MNAGSLINQVIRQMMRMRRQSARKPGGRVGQGNQTMRKTRSVMRFARFFRRF